MKRVEPKPCEAFKIDKIKFEANSHLILDVFPPVFFFKICIATSHLSGVMVNTRFPVMDEVIWGFKSSELNFFHHKCLLPDVILNEGVNKLTRRKHFL